MTYYEVVSYLDKLITSPFTEKDILALEEANIVLDGPRYDRFIVQVNHFLNERLKKYFDTFIDKILTANFTKDEFALELNLLMNEINLIERMIDIKYIKEDNREIFRSSLHKNIVNMLENMKELFIDEEKIQLLDEMIKKEDVNNELQ